MSKPWYLVEGHLGEDGWVLVDATNPNQADEIEEICETCFDNDWIIGVAGTLKEARKLCGEHYDNDYGREKCIKSSNSYWRGNNEKYRLNNYERSLGKIYYSRLHERLQTFRKSDYEA